MKIYSPTITGSVANTNIITTNQTGSLSVLSSSFAASAITASFATNSITSSFALNATTASFATSATTASFAASATTSSYASEASSANTASYVVSSQTDTTQNSRLAATEALTGSFATTGSNTFFGTQVFTGSVYITSNLIVQGSSSLQNITASAVSIGTNTVILNTDSPSVRFAGISVRDSGSNSAVTSSIWYDSLNNKWIYQNESGSSYSGGMFISGPRNTGSLGSEVGLTSGYITKGLGGDHIGESIIFESGSTYIGIGTASPSYKLDVSGTGRFTSTLNANSILNVGNDLNVNKADSDTVYTGGQIWLSGTYTTIRSGTDHSFNIDTYNDGGSRTNALNIIQNGNVGIGITNSDSKLQISSGATRALRIDCNSGVQAISINPNGVFGVDEPGVGNGRFIINTNGRIGIGTNSPGAKLEVSGQTLLSNGGSNALQINTTVADENTRDAIYLYENSGQATGRQAISWYNGGNSYYKARLWTEVGGGYTATQFGIDVADDARSVSTRMYIRNGSANFSGDVTAYASDERLKENIRPILNAIDKIKEINGVYYDWKDSVSELGFTATSKSDVGVLAQQIQKVLPEIVKPAPFDQENGESKSGENYLTVKYEKIVPLLIEAVKEQQKQIEDLKSIINDLTK